MKKDDLRWIVFIALLFGFILGFYTARAIYDERGVTTEEYLESREQGPYE
jgi:hypothetical protein